MPLDIRHVAVAVVVAAADVAMLYFKLIPETAGVSILSALVGLLIPTTYRTPSNPPAE